MAKKKEVKTKMEKSSKSEMKNDKMMVAHKKFMGHGKKK